MGARPDPPRPLTTPAIVDAARRVADSEGLTGLNLRRVARELGTGQASLYRHIGGRRELMTLLAGDLASGFPLVRAEEAPVFEQVVLQWKALRRHLLEHPWGASIIAEGEWVPDSAQPVFEHCLALLRAAGLDRAAALQTYRTLWHLLLGDLLSHHPFGHAAGESREPEEAFTWGVRSLLLGSGASPTPGT
ncbi:MAG TPA: helix-turn-helix domain-containing protein [Candidatus Dormibacteraeota bacterium]|jgi:AcrR family transcriptional regulator|nr:helix-turn-helix domain-containing protein [Candidatus Dormibacteraeota bacterium]